MHDENVALTVPWDPDGEGEQLYGRTIRAVLWTASQARGQGYTAAELRARPRWGEPSIPGALIRTAVRWGLIP